MRKTLSLLLLLLTGRLSAQEVIHLLPGSDLPKLTVYRSAKSHRHSAAAIICPGGLFQYAHGGHAYGIDTRSAKVQWIDACVNWIRQRDRKNKNEQ